MLFCLYGSDLERDVQREDENTLLDRSHQDRFIYWAKQTNGQQFHPTSRLQYHNYPK